MLAHFHCSHLDVGRAACLLCILIVHRVAVINTEVKCAMAPISHLRYHGSFNSEIKKNPPPHIKVRVPSRICLMCPTRPIGASLHKPLANVDNISSSRESRQRLGVIDTGVGVVLALCCLFCCASIGYLEIWCIDISGIALFAPMSYVLLCDFLRLFSSIYVKNVIEIFEGN